MRSEAEMQAGDIANVTGRLLDVRVAELVMGQHVKVDTQQIGTAGDETGMHAVFSTAHYRLVDDKGDYICGYGYLMHGYGPIEVPAYSKSTIAAWQVVEYLRAKGYRWMIECLVSAGDRGIPGKSGGPNPDVYVVSVWLARRQDGTPTDSLRTATHARAPSVELAICLASLQAIEASK